MAYTIVEVAESSGSFNGSASVSLSTTPLSGDIVVVAFGCANTNAITAISGLGATWSTEYEISSTGITHLHRMGVGATASGSISITLSQSGANARNGLVRAYLIRGGGSSPTIAGVTATNFSATGLTGTSQTAGSSDLVITQMGSQTSTRPISWPSAQSPSGAFTVGSQVNAGANTFNTGYATPASSASHSTTMAFTGGSGAVTNRISQIVLTTTGGGGTTVTPPVATTTTDGLDPTVGMGITPPVATGSTDALDPVIDLAGETLLPPVATMTTDALDSVVAATVLPPVAPTTSDALDPFMVSGGDLTPPVATADTNALAPTIIVGAITPITLEFEIGTAFEITDVLDVTPITLEFLIGTAFRLNLPNAQPPDPRTGAPQYRWVITHRDGTRYGELYDVAADAVEQTLNETGRTKFTIATEHPLFDMVQPIVRECQVWRGSELVHKGPIMVGRESDDGTTTTFEVPDPRWYYEHGRFLAKVPRTNLLRNGGFTEGPSGFAYWTASYDAESLPALPPLWERIDEPEALSGKALVVQGADETQLHTEDVETAAVFVPNSASYLSGGEAAIEAVGDDIPDGATVRITGHTANDGTGSGLTLSLNRAIAAKNTLAAQNGTLVFVTPDTSRWPAGTFVTGSNCAGRGYFEPISKSLAPNRRVSIAWEGILSAEGHKQYVMQAVYVTQPVDAKYPLTLTVNARYKLLEYVAASADGWNLRVRAVLGSTEIDSGSASISEDTPLDRWFDLEASVEIPADGQQYRIEVRLYPPAGAAEFADVGLYPEELLYFWGVDQAFIVRDVVQFIQNPANGWSDLGITTRTPATGILRDRSYELTNGSPLPAAQVLEEFPSLARGMDIGMTLTHDLTRLDTHYPRQGGPSALAFVEGGNVAASRPASSWDVYSLVVMRANSGGAYRPEALAKDETALDGLLLGMYDTAEAECPVTELDEAAQAALARSKGAVSGWWVQCDPAYTSTLRERIGLGDTARAALYSRGFDGLVRVAKILLDPDTDALTYLLAVED